MNSKIYVVCVWSCTIFAVAIVWTMAVALAILGLTNFETFIMRSDPMSVSIVTSITLLLSFVMCSLLADIKGGNNA